MSEAPKPLIEAALQLRELLKTKERLAEETKANNKAIEHIQVHVLPSLMDDNSMPFFGVAGGGVVRLKTEVYVHVPAASREDLKDWLRGTDNEDMITESVNDKTFQAFVKSLLDDQAENGVTNSNTYPEFVKVTQIPTAKLKGK